MTVVSGSLPGLGDARDFYAGLDVRPVDFARGDAPMHPSYEDRPSAPDPVFAAVDDGAYEAHVAAWCRALEGADAAGADLLHLHHLTPLHEAAARVAPDVPVLGHLHGTELLMLEEILDGAHPDWAHADAWLLRMRRWAARCERLLVLSPDQVGPRGGPAAPRSRPLRGRAQRLRPRALRAASGRPRRPLAPPPRRRAARLATGRRGGVASPTTRTRFVRSRRGPCCWPSAASPRSSACPCSSARSRAPRSASPSRPRSSCSGASRASGRASTRST